jgi:hypothetical protein
MKYEEISIMWGNFLTHAEGRKQGEERSAVLIGRYIDMLD